ncbi:DHA2 family efflux MFS transporter permease subunit [Acidiferrimicrobium sp. IK]|uniref:DHA2 family efflux MFS transporter permease subunit n=1 Tax=Acidiferrimicrobium sp. IK TaxID=2871700 RepID=UPI0021CB8F72|nr:DHA2 family efflux MFS transporter permease subunit [Acidiferrimicrobium sp. IK]MCU4187161.1 DHA2 family efflux MFS transporter permease subunit [Acidiferrimicrobium sp. IK]
MPRSRLIWTFVITSVASFMVSLDNLVVTMALPSIRSHLHASLASLEWTINAYTLSFAVLILTGAALGDRFGRRRVLTLGLAVFTLASAGAAMAPDVTVLVIARAVQGAGAAAVLPLTFTILASAVPAERRGAALGVLGGVSGLAVAVGPLVGGAVVQGASWQWIFWINVPIGLAALPFAATRLSETRARAHLDPLGLILASAGLFGIVFGLVKASDDGWTSPAVLAPLAAGVVAMIGFIFWQARAAHPMLPLRFFRNRAFAASNAASLLFSFGMFGSIFLLAQFLQTALGYSPLEAGLRTLPWTAMPLLVAPVAGPLSDRIGGRPFMVGGLALQAAGLAWVAALIGTHTTYLALVAPFVLCGLGMALFFIPVANVVLGAVPAADQGAASGANNAIRELGGVLGIAVLATVFAGHGSYASPASFAGGLRWATWVGAGVVGVGALAAAAIPGRRRAASLGDVPVSEVMAPA